ncbi:MAG: SIMPL domain-containing protein [bacterium]
MIRHPNIKNVFWFVVKSTYLLFAISIVIGALVVFIFWNTERTSNNILSSNSNQFRVTADAKRFVKPDAANIVLTTIIKGKEVREVQAKASEIINKATAEIKKLGVLEEEIKTSNYNISPEYDYSSSKQVLIGYSSSISLTIKTKLLDKVGAIIDSATQNGINSVSSLNFYIEDLTKVQDELKLQAIENAKVKAIELARTSGLNLGKLKNVEDANSYNPYVYSPMLNSVSDSMAKSSPSSEPINLTVQAGQSEISSSVTLVYQID